MSGEKILASSIHRALEVAPCGLGLPEGQTNVAASLQRERDVPVRRAVPAFEDGDGALDDGVGRWGGRGRAAASPHA